MSSEKKFWVKLVLAAGIGGGVVQGAGKLAEDSPIHFAVEGAAPLDAPGWKCAPEGGLIGAPMVCHPVLGEKSDATITDIAVTPQ